MNGRRAIVARLASLLRTFWLMAGLALLLFLGLELGTRIYCYFRYQLPAAWQPAPVDPRARSEVYADAPWSADYFREFHESNVMDWHPYVYWKNRPYAGEYIAIGADGQRLTINRVPAERAAVRIFLFGGSAIWGTGARDAWTIPSCLSRALEERGYAGVSAVNFGMSGYVSTQEAIQLLLELDRGNRPDIVLFYDGVNDVFSAFQNRRAGLPQNEENRRFEFNLKQDLLDRVNLPAWLGERSMFLHGVLLWRERFATGAREVGGGAGAGAAGGGGGGTADREPPPAGGGTGSGAAGGEQPPSAEGVSAGAAGDEPRATAGPGLAEEVVRIYRANARLVEAWAEKEGFEAYFFWQPTVFSKDPLSAEETVTRDGQAELGEFFDLVYSRIRAPGEGPSEFHDLQDLFDAREETTFCDFSHIGEEGNRLVAERMLQVLEGRSQVLARLRGGPTAPMVGEEAAGDR